MPFDRYDSTRAAITHFSAEVPSSMSHIIFVTNIFFNKNGIHLFIARKIMNFLQFFVENKTNASAIYFLDSDFVCESIAIVTAFDK